MAFRTRFCLLLLICSFSAGASTIDFYVDSGRSSNGDGSQANPWKLYDNIVWATVTNSILTNSVNLYFSSRTQWVAGNMIIPSGNDTNTFRFVGDEKFNTTASGTATWQTETDPNTHRALFQPDFPGHGGGAVVYISDNGENHITFKGIKLLGGTDGGILIGYNATAPPATNIYNITIENCIVDSNPVGFGIAFGFLEAGCHDLTVRHCVVTNCPREAIYTGHYSYLVDTITNVLIESNIVANCGFEGFEGDIDVKPGCYGAIIRYNQHYRTSYGRGGTECGVVIGCSAAQIYGNAFYLMATNSANNDWGHGIYVNADGDGTGLGKGVVGCTIYNNLIYGNDGMGIKFGATATTVGADISGVKIWNNTIVGNHIGNGVSFGTASGRTITVDEFKNNVIVGNTNYDLSLSSGVTLSSCDYNLYNRASGASWQVAGADKTWAQWQALGYDAHGLTNNPLFISETIPNYYLQSNSPAINAGTTIGTFSIDYAGTSRPQSTAWDIGAYEFVTNSPQAYGNRIRGIRLTR